MKKLNEGQFFHVKSQIYDNEFHVPSFPCRTHFSVPYPLLLLFTPHQLKIVYFSTNPVLWL